MLSFSFKDSLTNLPNFLVHFLMLPSALLVNDLCVLAPGIITDYLPVGVLLILKSGKVKLRSALLLGADYAAIPLSILYRFD
jgi:hypothetical protein